MFIESVVVSGPELPDASVYFTKGANVVQGGSDTGKSYIVQCIKFALGATEPPKPIALSRAIPPLNSSLKTMMEVSLP